MTILSRRALLQLGAGLSGASFLGPLPAMADPPSHLSHDASASAGHGFPIHGPTLWTTNQMLERATKSIEKREQPFFDAWTKVQARADNALGTAYTPYQGPKYLTYFHIGRAQAQVARALGLAYRLTGREAYAGKARQILLQWAAAQTANHYPDSYPSSDVPLGAGLVISRVVSVFADAYAIVYDTLSSDDRSRIGAWFRDMVAPIRHSEFIWEHTSLPGLPAPYLDHQYFQNHLTANDLGLMSIGFALGDQQLIRYATKKPQNNRDLQDLIVGAIIMPDDFRSGTPGDIWYKDPTYTRGAPAPQAGEIYDRYRILSGHGLYYSLFSLEMLTLMAEQVYNNRYGVDYYRYVGPHGENLEVAFQFYAEFLITHDPASRTGYYGNEIGGVSASWVPLYEIAHRHYPRNKSIARVLEVNSRLQDDVEFLGWSSVLTNGLDDIR